MFKRTVVNFFGNQSKVSRALNVSRSYVSAWPDLVPELQAVRLERLTNGELKYDPSLYETKHKQSA